MAVEQLGVVKKDFNEVLIFSHKNSSRMFIVLREGVVLDYAREGWVHHDPLHMRVTSIFFLLFHSPSQTQDVMTIHDIFVK